MAHSSVADRRPTIVRTSIRSNTMPRAAPVPSSPSIAVRFLAPSRVAARASDT